MVAPNVIVLNMKNATQYPNRGDDDTGDDDIVIVDGVVTIPNGYLSQQPALQSSIDAPPTST